MKFQVGDRVIMVRNQDRLRQGMIGTICKMLHEAHNMPGVEFDEAFGGHDCDRHARIGHGYYVFRENLELYDDSNTVQEDELLSIIGGE